MKTYRVAVLRFLLVITLLSMFFVYKPVLAEESVCATVKIEIQQELTLERQAFDANMKINNGLEGYALEDVKVVVNFQDENNEPVFATSDPNDTSAKFFIRIDSLDGIENVDGTGVVEAQSTAEVHWLIIPAPGAAEDAPLGKLYFIGASLSYSYGGKLESVEVIPDQITVKPMPQLTLDYFLPNDVYADDPFTDQIEPPEPFSLGVRVKNNGIAAAQSLKIESAQPKIVENEQGLLIGFQLTGSQVNDKAVQNSLLLDMGDIAANDSTIGRWSMLTTLSGRFTEFDAEYSHSDELGGSLTSLIAAVDTHFLLRDVLVDAPGRDGIRDFLANDSDVLRVYESESIENTVADLSASASLSFVKKNGLDEEYVLNTSTSTELMYIKLLDVNAGQYEIKNVIRSDGKRIPMSNVWFWKHKNKDSKKWEYYLSLFDYNSTGSYRLVLNEKRAIPVAPVLQYISDKTVVEGHQISFLVEASDANETSPTINVSGLPQNAHFYIDPETEGAPFVRYILDWTPNAEQVGRHEISYIATDGVLQSRRKAYITVRSSNDTDGDGLPDDWEIEHFGDLSQTAEGDFDGDGITNLEEYLNNSNPTGNSSSGVLSSQLATISSRWSKERFASPFIQPPVILSGVVSDLDEAPGTVSVRNVSETGFEISYQEWRYLDWFHRPEVVPFLVLEEGRYTQADGSIWEVGKLDVQGNGQWNQLTYTGEFSGEPRVFVSLQTSNGAYPAEARVRNVNASGFEVALFEEEKRRNSEHRTEQIGYLAIYSPTSSGSVIVSNEVVPYDVLQHGLSSVADEIFDRTISLQEESSSDDELSHAVETVDVLSLGYSVFIQDVSTDEADVHTPRLQARSDADDDGIPDVVELSVGLDPSNRDDASLDLDNDGYSNLDEYEAGTLLADEASNPAALMWGLTGTTETPQQTAYPGKEFTCRYSVTNQTDVDLQNISMRYQLYDMDQEITISDSSESIAALGRLSSHSIIDSINIDTLTLNSSYACITLIEDGADRVVLSAARFDVKDEPRIVLSHDSLIVDENNGTGTFSVELNAIPDSDVVLSVRSTNIVDATTDVSQLVFTRDNWDISQPVSVFGVDDIIDSDDTTSVVLSVIIEESDRLYHQVANQQLLVELSNDDKAGFTLTTNHLTIDEASGSAEFSVSLNTMPESDVEILVSSASEALSISSSVLTFTPDLWDQPQAVLLTGIDDAIDRDETTEILINVSGSVSDSHYAVLEQQVIAVALIDDDQAAITISPSVFTINENSGAGSFSVVLNSQPLSDVTLSVDYDATEVVVASPVLRFTDANWKQPQIISVSGVDDDFDRDDVTKLILTVENSTVDAVYAGLPASIITVHLANNDNAGLIVSDTNLVIDESSGASSFSIMLRSKPVSTVILDFGYDESDVRLDINGLSFSPENWNQPQSVSVVAINDDVDRDDYAVISIDVSSATLDGNYSNLASHKINVALVDDDSASVHLSSHAITINENNGSENFTVVLGSEPEADVELALSFDSAEVSLNNAVLRFTPDNWNQAQSVVVTGVDDAVDRDDSTSVLVEVAAGSDQGYMAVPSQQLSLTLLDNDQSGFALSTHSLSIEEQGGTGDFEVVLNSEPEGHVEISFAYEANDIGLSLQTLLFSSANWNQAQTVRVTGVADSIDRDNSTAISAEVSRAASDLSFTKLPAQELIVTLIDDDVAGVLLDKTELTIDENAGAESIHISLSSQPLNAVTLMLAHDIEEVTLSGQRLSFTASNWATPQSVLVTAVDDAFDRDDTSDIVISVDKSNSDEGYWQVTSQRVKVSLTDDDVLGVEGSVVAEYPILENGDVQVCNISLENSGTMDIIALPLYLTVMDAAGERVHEITREVSIAVQASKQFSDSIQTEGLANGSYRCVLAVMIAGESMQLGASSFVLEEPKIDLSLNLDRSGVGRVLVLMDNDEETCRGVKSITLREDFSKAQNKNAYIQLDIYDENGKWYDAEGEKIKLFNEPLNSNKGKKVDLSIDSLNRNGFEITIGSPNNIIAKSLKLEGYSYRGRKQSKILDIPLDFTCDKVPSIGDTLGGLDVIAVDVGEIVIQNGNNKFESPLRSMQKNILQAWVESKGMSYELVHSDEAFGTALLSGKFNQYLLLAANINLKNKTVRLLRESVFRGDGLVYASGKNVYNKELSSILGLKYRKRTTFATGVGVRIASSDWAEVESANLLLNRKTPVIAAISATVEGYLDLKYSNDELAVLTRHQYGEGEALYIGYDILAEIAYDAASAENHEAILQASLKRTVPNSYPIREGVVIPIEFSVENKGNAVSVKATLTQGKGTELVDAYPFGVASDDDFLWEFTLEEGTTSLVKAWLLPEYESGVVDIDLLIEVQEGEGSYQYYEQRSLTLNLVATDAMLLEIEHIIDELTLYGNQNKDIKKAIKRTKVALKRLKKDQKGKARDQLLNATNFLGVSSDSVIDELRERIDWVIWELSR